MSIGWRVGCAPLGAVPDDIFFYLLSAYHCPGLKDSPRSSYQCWMWLFVCLMLASQMVDSMARNMKNVSQKGNLKPARKVSKLLKVGEALPWA